MALLSRRASRRGVWLAGFCLVFGFAGNAGHAADAPSEQQVKAAYLFNFARYVDWPSSVYGAASDPLRICVLGDDDFMDIARSSVGNRKIEERSVSVESRSGVAESSSCQILFITSEQSRLEQDVVAGLAKRSVFTVSDSDGFARSGGVANFVRVGNKIRFEITRNSAERAGLKLSSKLLRIAQVVE